MEYTGSLRVYMLGGFEMYYDGALLQMKKKQTSKPVQLLQLLLYHKEDGISRHALLETLYGQETEIDAANSLNATVSQLRKLLRDLIVGPPLLQRAAKGENNQNLARNDMFVAECYANEGPTLKRIQAVSKGRAYRINKRTSHITVILDTVKA